MRTRTTTMRWLTVTALVTAAMAPVGIAHAAESCMGKAATIVGTASADTIQGTSGSDVIVGLDGDDKVDGVDGNDIICAGAGRDLVLGGEGDDIVLGEDGSDNELFGFSIYVNGEALRVSPFRRAGSTAGPGNDRINGGTGNNDLYGEDGDDVLVTGDGGGNADGVPIADQNSLYRRPRQRPAHRRERGRRTDRSTRATTT